MRPSRRAASGRLLVGSHEIVLKPGVSIIGRGEEADIAILASLVSRKHAKIENTPTGVSIEDLQSANGVFVNGTPITEPTKLLEGDSILIGTLELCFFHGTDDAADTTGRIVLDECGQRVDVSGSTDESESPTLLRLDVPEDDAVHIPDDPTIQGSKPPQPSSRRRRRPTGDEPVTSRPPPTPLTESGPLPKLAPTSSAPPEPRVFPRGGQTLAKVTLRSGHRDRDEQTIVLEVVQRMLERDDVEAAERTLAGQMRRRLDEAKEGKHLAPPVLDATAVCCLDLARATSNAQWVEWVLHLHIASRAPLSDGAVDRLEYALETLPVTRSLLADYQLVLRERLGELDASQLPACERVLYFAPDE